MRWMTASRSVGLLGLLLSLGCGPSTVQRTLPDESQDLAIGEESITSTHLAGTTPVGPEIGGSRWQWVEATCTEGAPEAEGFSQQVQVQSDNEGLLFVYDQTFEGTDCRETVVQRARPGSDVDAAWNMQEQSRIRLGECSTTPENDRPGDVRMRGQFLEVYVQRSVWCGGLEVRHVYAPTQATEPTGADLAMHYAAHFNRQDARNVTILFSDAGSLVEPFNLTATGGPTRHDGRDDIYRWYQEAFSNTPWLAMRVTNIEDTDTGVNLHWQYMDPRLDVPFAGVNRFTIAGGEIFESSIEITAQAVEDEPALEDGSGEEGTPEEAATAEGEAEEATEANAGE